jgi:hypothetical protein
MWWWVVLLRSTKEALSVWDPLGDTWPKGSWPRIFTRYWSSMNSAIFTRHRHQGNWVLSWERMRVQTEWSIDGRLPSPLQPCNSYSSGTWIDFIWSEIDYRSMNLTRKEKRLKYLRKKSWNKALWSEHKAGGVSGLTPEENAPFLTIGEPEAFIEYPWFYLDFKDILMPSQPIWDVSAQFPMPTVGVAVLSSVFPLAFLWRVHQPTCCS